MTPGPDMIALVTGASRGFGYAAAAALGAAGATVVGMARTVGGLEDLADAIEAAGGPGPVLAPLSIADEGGLARLCLAIHERWGRLDLVVHAAAHAAPLSPAHHIAAKDFDASVEVNLRGTQRLIRMVAPLLEAAPAGVFVQVADDRAGRPFWGSYGATKAAADALAASWARETERIGPRVLLFRPEPMPTALRSRFYPAEDRSRLSPCRAEAARLLAELAAVPSLA
ncbi:SDR family NAD(P)-dependent oxidoreductase [Amaricoccus sp.]|uniref:SDR family NAD(P)-dependent oxidoreductase n=1 Tax=Amaricoccus sp. TaxID=1872485 RepID=UPI001B726491|nr:SDR family NAD(P)-dependent oxidoreductase [Amaricoccus sp.]MBP7001321.1 SDR family NAD(P)-dependent oxidoreductase [Amaricoccus sp.]